MTTTPRTAGVCGPIHVADIASAHAAAARALREKRITALTANIGRGQGVAVREVVSVIRSVTGTATEDWAEPVVEPRHPGDPARVVAAADRIRVSLGWEAQHDVRSMVESAWEGWRAPAAAEDGG